MITAKSAKCSQFLFARNQSISYIERNIKISQCLHHKNNTQIQSTKKCSRPSDELQTIQSIKDHLMNN